LLLALPGECLIGILQCCAADDYCSLFSAARAHSKLHQAALAALRSMTVAVTQQQQMDGVLLFLGKHSQHIDSLRFKNPNLSDVRITLRELPSNLQLSSLQLQWFDLQLQPGDGFQSVLGAAALTQLQLSGCRLLDSGTAAALAAALSQLPAGLQHLSMNYTTNLDGRSVPFLTSALQRLQQLTYLELGFVELQSPAATAAPPAAVAEGVLLSDRRSEVQDSPVLQFLQAMTRLVRLRLNRVTTGMPLGSEWAASAIALALEHACDESFPLRALGQWEKSYGATVKGDALIPCC
jgi:hypothetical protein